MGCMRQRQFFLSLHLSSDLKGNIVAQAFPSDLGAFIWSHLLPIDMVLAYTCPNFFFFFFIWYITCECLLPARKQTMNFVQ